MGLSPKLLAPIYTITNPGLGEGPVVPELVWGPNMAVRTAVFEAGHRFDETIGPDGTDHYPMGSETSFVRKLGQCGYRAWHVPSARVQHVIRPFQLDRGWILRRAQRYGRGEYRMLNQGGPCEQLPTLFGYPRWAVRRLAKLMLRQLLSFRWLTPGRFLEADWEYHKFLGYVKEAKKGGGNERH